MNESTLSAGVARRVITPPKGVYQIGYGDRTKGNIGIHDDLTATALVLDDGTTRVAIVALDMLTINEFIVDRVRARLAPTEVLLCCSHTHSGPIAYADEKSPRRNREYIDSLVANIVEDVQEAQANLLSARLEYSHGEANVGINRREKMPDGHFEIGRNPEGARDKSVQVLSVFALIPSPSPKGGREYSPLPAGEGLGVRERLATVVNYACHGTVLGPDNLLVSADWIGVMRKKVEEELGGLTLFLQGAAANINPDMYWEDARAFEMVAEQGLSVANAVLAATSQTSEKMRGLPVQVERVEAWMPTETRVTSSRPPKNYRKSLLEMAKLPGFMAVFADLLLNQRYPWKPVIEARDGFWSVPMRVNAVRIGDLALVTFGAETFTEIGMKVKAASPAAHTLFASVSDGCISYLHTEASHAEGGYEVDVAPLAYRYPGRFQAKCEGIALETTADILKKLWS
jgi:neutral ceramidase